VIEFIVIVESSADKRTATKLAERILVDKVDWLEPETLQYLFQWSGLEAGTEQSCWTNINDITKRLSEQLKFKFPTIRTNGKIQSDGKPAIKVLKLISFLKRKQNRQIKAVLFIRDLDNQPERRTDIDQARSEHIKGQAEYLDNQPERKTDIDQACSEHIKRQAQLEIVIGTADRMREAWVLNGFIPSNQQEQQILEDITAKLTFDPCKESHRLRSKSFEEPERIRNLKVVVELLTGGKDKMERQQQCWEETSLEILRERGIHTGLTAYIHEIEQRLTPIIGSE
jgi:hypothetical protein